MSDMASDCPSMRGSELNPYVTLGDGCGACARHTLERAVPRVYRRTSGTQQEASCTWLVWEAEPVADADVDALLADPAADRGIEMFKHGSPTCSPTAPHTKRSRGGLSDQSR